MKKATIPVMLAIWQLGVYDFSKIEYASFGNIAKDKKKLFLKNLKWLGKKVKEIK